MGGLFSSKRHFVFPVKDDECKFRDPNISHNFSFKNKEVYVIDAAEDVLHRLQACDILYVDCIGENFGSPNVKLDLVQIATSSECCFIFTCKDEVEFEVLNEVLEDETIKKVFHDCAHKIAALALATIGGQQGITVCNFEDTQIAQLFVHKTRNLDLVVEQLPKLSLSDLYTYCFGDDFPQVYTGPEENLSKWISGSLDERKIQHAALQVLLLKRMYHYLMENIYPQKNMDGYRNMVAEVARR